MLEKTKVVVRSRRSGGWWAGSGGPGGEANVDHSKKMSTLNDYHTYHYQHSRLTRPQWPLKCNDCSPSSCPRGRLLSRRSKNTGRLFRRKCCSHRRTRRQSRPFLRPLLSPRRASSRRPKPLLLHLETGYKCSAAARAKPSRPSRALASTTARILVTSDATDASSWPAATRAQSKPSISTRELFSRHGRSTSSPCGLPSGARRN